jgi:hypothetical protein
MAFDGLRYPCAGTTLLKGIGLTTSVALSNTITTTSRDIAVQASIAELDRQAASSDMATSIKHKINEATAKFKLGHTRGWT